MTKKATKIVEVMRDKMNTQAWLFENEFIDLKKLQKRLGEEEKQYTDLITGMFHYGLLSESDFTEIYSYANDKRDLVVDTAIGNF